MNESLCRVSSVFRLPYFNLSLSLLDFLLLHRLPNGLYLISLGLNVVGGTTPSSLVFFFGGRPLGLGVKSICGCGSIAAASSV